MTLMTRSNPESVQRCVGVSWPLSVSISYERELVTPAHPAHLLALAPVLRTGSLALRSSLRFATRFALAARSHPAPLRSAGGTAEGIENMKKPSVQPRRGWVTRSKGRREAPTRSGAVDTCSRAPGLGVRDRGHPVNRDPASVGLNTRRTVPPRPTWSALRSSTSGGPSTERNHR